MVSCICCALPKIGTLKNIPLSKLPSPNSSADTSVNVAKAPKLTPFANVRENSIVEPMSPAKYSPADNLGQTELIHNFYNKNYQLK